MPNFFKEIVESHAKPEAIDVLINPLNILKGLLVKVGQRASELNDPQLNALMCRLTIYEVADPQTKGYNQKMVDKILKESEKIDGGEE